MPVDEARKKRRWFQGTPPNAFEKRGYADGTLMCTEDLPDAYPDLDAAILDVRNPHKMPYYCRVGISTPCSPFFSHYEVRVDDGAPERMEGIEYPWRLHAGTCTFEARTVSLGGWRGPAYRIAVHVGTNKQRKPAWP
jgi:hypothetical protein